jgi:carboxypeptidase Q
MKRLYNRGKHIVVQMDIRSRSHGTCTSRNTFFDIRGSTYPEQIVLLSAHMDSWDVGQGAMDDGGGMAATWQAMNTLNQFAKLDPAFVPKR